MRREPKPHATTRLRLRYRIDIDQGIADLIRVCWRRGLRTRHCCQGDARDRGDGYVLHGQPGYTDLAYIQFESALEAAVFVARAGPFAWLRKDHVLRHAEYAPSPRSNLDWSLEGDIVRFPNRDIDRASRALQRYSWTLAGFIAAADVSASAERNRPERLCQTCGESVPPWRRRDAIYCGRKCQLKARVRGQPRGIDQATADPTLRARLRGTRG